MKEVWANELMEGKTATASYVITERFPGQCLTLVPTKG